MPTAQFASRNSTHTIRLSRCHVATCIASTVRHSGLTRATARRNAPVAAHSKATKSSNSGLVRAAPKHPSHRPPLHAEKAQRRGRRRSQHVIRLSRSLSLGGKATPCLVHSLSVYISLLLIVFTQHNLISRVGHSSTLIQYLQGMWT